MKKILLSTFAVASLVATAQNPTTLVEEMDGATPCFLTWDPAGAFQGAAGHDFTNMVYDDTQEDGIMTFSAKTHASNHGPLYYYLSAGDDMECSPGEGAVDISANNKVELRIKASANVRVNVYIQEGNAPSWDYSKFSESSAEIDVTTDWQFVTLENVSTVSMGASAFDLTNIGGVAFELGKTDGTNYDVIDGTVSVDFIRFGEAAVSSNEVVAEGFNVFPNPATDILNVKFDATSATTVELTDLTGKVVASQLVQAGAVNTTFATADINAGIYFVNVKNAVGSTTQKVVIK